ncbi:hypothetical protein [Mesorhizobium mediterraneum]|uniref:hypothetical protein n=1 Tax=Mesorhizobium mediterraneum TaxID=43617 RepID=UPI00177F0FB2|nr:hypothetical protein [Mesorhizobium mediterraneum]
MAVIINKKDRSPSFPFISLRKAVERAKQVLDAHKREAARLATVAPTWGYAAKSSGLLQTVAALKQYGLIEDSGSGEERRIKLSDLGRRILTDERPGAKEPALKEAARNPRLFAEYIDRWAGDFPDDRHCISELSLDRGFTPEAAKTFVKVLRITIKYAGIVSSDGLSSYQDVDASDREQEEVVQPPIQEAVPASSVLPSLLDSALPPIGAKPLGQRLRVTTDGNRISVEAELVSASEIDKLVRILLANKALMDETDETHQ